MEEEIEYNQHIERKNIAREVMLTSIAEARNPGSKVQIFDFDMQKTRTLPKTEVGPMYYFCKLNAWNLTFYNFGNHEGSCYVWDETLGKKGSNEIASYLTKYVDDLMLRKPNTEEIIMYSDNCFGQNKNQIVFTAVILLAIKHKVTIRHR